MIKDGWYLTGDIGYVDPDGFLKITDRISRFSKIAGEMVPHLAIESAIMEATGVDENQVAVTGVPDPKHGERLCVLYTDLGISPAEVQQRLIGRIVAQGLDSVAPRFHSRRGDPHHIHGQGRLATIEDRPSAPARPRCT